MGALKPKFKKKYQTPIEATAGHPLLQDTR